MANSETNKDDSSSLDNTNVALAVIMKAQIQQEEIKRTLERRNSRLEKKNRNLRIRTKKKAPLTVMEEIPEEENYFDNMQDDEHVHIADTSNEETKDPFPKGSKGVQNEEESLSEGSYDINPRHNRKKEGRIRSKANDVYENLAGGNSKRADNPREKSTRSKLESY